MGREKQPSAESGQKPPPPIADTYSEIGGQAGAIPHE